MREMLAEEFLKSRFTGSNRRLFHVQTPGRRPWWSTPRTSWREAPGKGTQGKTRKPSKGLERKYGGKFTSRIDGLTREKFYECYGISSLSMALQYSSSSSFERCRRHAPTTRTLIRSCINVALFIQWVRLERRCIHLTNGRWVWDLYF